MVVTLGERGGQYLLDEFGEEFIAAQRVEAIDSSGAGDAFSAGWPWRWARVSDFAAHCGNAVAALSVTRAGTQASFPKRQEVASYLPLSMGRNQLAFERQQVFVALLRKARRQSTSIAIRERNS